MLATAHSAGHSAQRVKVYRLSESGRWDDKGTGHVSIQHLEQANSLGLVVVSEDDHRALLVHRISKEDIYSRKSEDTIITWNDVHLGTDIALSFEENIGCNTIWDGIQRLQDGSIGSPDSPGRRRVVDEFEANYDDLPEIGPPAPVTLPPADLSNLPELIKALNDVSYLNRETLAGQLQAAGYPRKILDLFRQCEDLEDVDLLHQLYHVVKGMIMLGDATLLESLLSPDNFMDVVGALEYEPGVAVQPKHRDFLRQQVVFKEVVPIQDPAVRQRIHQSYQMGYLKDVVLPRVLDDQTFAALSSLMLFYNHDILTTLQSDPKFFPELFDALRQTPPEDPKWTDLVRLLQELCSQAKHLQPQHRQQLLSKLVSLGLFEVIETVVEHGNETLQYKAVDVLLSSVHHDPNNLRTHMQQDNGKKLLGQLLQLMIDSSDAGLQEQILEMMRLLLDPDTSEQPTEQDKFLEMFYQDQMDRLVQPIIDAPTQQGGTASQRKARARTLGVIVDLLSFCVQHHTFRIKYYALKNNTIAKVLKLLGRKEPWLVVTIVRFFRACVHLKDDFYNRHLIRFDLFRPLFDVFLGNGNRYNLLNSSVLDIMEYIRKENIKNLVAHIVETFYPELELIDYVDTFKQLKVKYDFNKEREQAGPAAEPSTAAAEAGPEGSRGRGPAETRGLNRSEEDYFNEEEDDKAPGDPQAGHGPGSGGPAADLPALDLPALPKLVDYEDDDDEGEDFLARGARHAPPDRPSSPSIAKRQRLQQAEAEEANGHGQQPLAGNTRISLSIKPQQHHKLFIKRAGSH